MLVRDGEYYQEGVPDSNIAELSFDDATHLKIHLLDDNWYMDGTQSKTVFEVKLPD